MGKHDYEYYSKIFDAVELVHKENVVLAQSIMRLAKNGHNNYDIEMLCDELESKWNEAFRDIRKW